VNSHCSGRHEVELVPAASGAVSSLLAAFGAALVGVNFSLLFKAQAEALGRCWNDHSLGNIGNQKAMSAHSHLFCEPDLVDSMGFCSHPK